MRITWNTPCRGSITIGMQIGRNVNLPTRGNAKCLNHRVEFTSTSHSQGAIISVTTLIVINTLIKYNYI